MTQDYVKGQNSRDGGPLGDAEWLKRLVANRCSDEEFGEAMKGRSFGGTVTYRLQERPSGNENLSTGASVDIRGPMCGSDHPECPQPGDERLHDLAQWADNGLEFAKRLLRWARRYEQLERQRRLQRDAAGRYIVVVRADPARDPGSPD